MAKIQEQQTDIDMLENIPPPAESQKLIGHEAILHGLIERFNNNKLAHGLIFTGLKGVGKATTAFHLAHNLLSSSIAGNAHKARTLIAQGVHPNLFHLTRQYDDKLKRFKTAITVDDIRKAETLFRNKAATEGWRICIIDSADDMNRNATNALLKILEEPPQKSLFILISHQNNRLLPTIRSRCQLVRFNSLSHEQIQSITQHFEDILPSDPNENERLITLAEGSVRRYLQYLNPDISSLDKVLQTIFQNKMPAPVSLLHETADIVSKKGGEMGYNFFLDQIARQTRTLMHKSLHEDGNKPRAYQIAGFYQKTEELRINNDIYNLDKKQLALNLLDNITKL